MKLFWNFLITKNKKKKKSKQFARFLYLVLSV
jgi:hypothetical protein